MKKLLLFLSAISSVIYADNIESMIKYKKGEIIPVYMISSLKNQRESIPNSWQQQIKNGAYLVQLRYNNVDKMCLGKNSKDRVVIESCI
jgi:hypothetical protein